jgi:hypothetical protein
VLYVLFSRGKTKLPDESMPEGMPEAPMSQPDVPSARVVKNDDDGT